LHRGIAPATMRRMNLLNASGQAWAILFARLVLGLIFGMAGWGKVFKMGPLMHAHKYFVDPYATSWIPAWLLWTLGLVIPFVELIAGWFVFLGLFTRVSLIALGCVLAIVTYGHLLKDFLYEFHTHVIPRLVLLVFILAMPSSQDVISVDHLLGRR
jgi:uncharacterized membrane protein YphA (DoxX/SURF4 family)